MNNLNSIRLSVALVTHNRPERLERCLESWKGQSVAPFEIVVSDDSGSEYRKQIKRIAEKHSCRYVEGPKRGLYANRNCAAVACAGTHVLSADEDHTHPEDFIEQVLKTVTKNPDRIWTFGEKHPWEPEKPISAPNELDVSGMGKLPDNPDDSAAVADGSTLYPRAVFDSGLRYDETYRFGNIYLLWGQILVKKGWQISYSDQTFVWHHYEGGERHSDKANLEYQLESIMYVAFVSALWVNTSAWRVFKCWLYLAKRMLTEESLPWFEVKCRIGIRSAVRMLYLAFSYPFRKETHAK